MKVESLNLHGLNLQQATVKTRQNIEWAVEHGVDVLVINHGKGYHSANNVAVLKSEIRKMLKSELSLAESGYRVIYGESDWPIALTYDEGNTLIVTRGLENEYIGGKSQQEKNKRIFSDDGRDARKAQKRMRHNHKSR